MFPTCFHNKSFFVFQTVETTTEVATETSSASIKFPADSSSATTNNHNHYEADDSEQTDHYRDKSSAVLHQKHRYLKRRSSGAKHRLLASAMFKERHQVRHLCRQYNRTHHAHAAQKFLKTCPFGLSSF